MSSVEETLARIEANLENHMARHEELEEKVSDLHKEVTGNGKLGIAQKNEIMWKAGPYAGGLVLLGLGGPKLWPYIQAFLF